MTTYTATIYQPGQPAQQLTVSQIASLGIKLTTLKQEPDFTTENGLYLVATEQEVARLLNVCAVDLLATENACAVYGLTNASDYEAQDNPEAMEQVERYFFPCGDLAGPILMIEETTSQTESVSTPMFSLLFDSPATGTPLEYQRFTNQPAAEKAKTNLEADQDSRWPNLRVVPATKH